MSKSTLKLKYFTIFNVTSYYQNLNDDIMQEEEDIIDIIYEPSQESKFIFCYLLLLSKGTLMYFEYNTTSKKITNIYTNNSLSMITNELICSELSFNSPIIVATSLNELILIETNQKPCQMINITEEEIIICSEPLDSQILNTKFNCNQTFILVVTINSIKLFKIGFDKIENKTILQFYNDLILPFLNPNNDYSLIFNKKVFLKFSNFLDNILIVSYISDKASSEEQIKLSFDSEELNDNNNNNDLVYLNLVQVNLSKKEISFNFIQCYSLDKTFVKIEFSYFYEKFFVLFEGGIICCLNNDQLNLNNNMTSDNGIIEISSNKKEKKNYDEKITFDNKIIFKYPLNSSNVKFIDMYIHPSSDFIVVRDSQSSFLIFDFTLNLYYIMYNSKISVKLNMDIFDSTEKVFNLKFKPYELNYFIKNSNSNFNINEEFKIDKELKNMILLQKIQNNGMFFYNSRVITGIFIEISSKFNQKNSLNTILDELKNHLRGQNFESSFKILMILNNFQQWIYSLFLITNKLCHHPQNILLIKRHSLSQALQYLKEKSFHDEEKNNTITNIRNLCFTNIVLRCLSIRQYEYAYLIIDKLQLTNLLKLLVSHCKLTKFLGINYLACTKLEENSESDENVITELNKIISSTNFTLSQNKLQSLIKDIDELIESDNLNVEYLKEYNSLEINLPKYYEGLQLEMEGKFEEAKELYRQNGLNYDYMRVEKLNKELLNQINEDSILEFNDIKLDKDI